MKTRPALFTLLLSVSPVHAVSVVDMIGDDSLFDPSGAQLPNASQIYTDPGFSVFDSMGVDDFSFAFDELKVRNVTAIFQAGQGFGSFQNIAGYQLSVFSELSAVGQSLLGDVANVFVAPGAGVSVTPFVTDEHALVSLDVDFQLPAAGTYYVGVAPVAAFGVAGQFFLHNSPSGDPQNPGNGYFANPESGFGVGTLTALEADFAIEILAVPEPSASFLLALGGLALVARRRPAPGRRLDRR